MNFSFNYTVMQAVSIDYTNWRGVRGRRDIVPMAISFGSNEYHKTDQWLLEAFDLNKGEPRSFAMSDIHSWASKEGAPMKVE